MGDSEGVKKMKIQPFFYKQEMALPLEISQAPKTKRPQIKLCDLPFFNFCTLRGT